MSFKDIPLEARREAYKENIANHPNSLALIIQVHPKSKIATQKYFKYA